MAKEQPARTIATVTTVEGDSVSFDSGVMVNAMEDRDIVAEVVAAIYKQDPDFPLLPDEEQEEPEHIDAVRVQEHTIAAVVQWNRGEDWRMFIELEPNE